MITKSKLRKAANAHSRKTERKDILYAYKLMCKNVKSRAKKGHFFMDLVRKDIMKNWKLLLDFSE